MFRSMSDKRMIEKAARAQRLVFGLGLCGFAENAAAQLLAAGWDVSHAESADAARKLAVRSRAGVVVLPVDPEEYLAAAKTITSLPKTRVVLLAPVRDARLLAFATAMKVAVVAETDGVPALVRAIVAAG